ncbi:MAG: NAD(P)H-quinone oxidoreductase [Bryobacterales bacterium]|nr:NAD(P)H-quinone oxidoreductase [Bryobacterales bacterium]
MRFITVTESRDLQLAEGPEPQPAPGEVLIRVAAAGVNRPDVMQRLGKYPPPPGASPILGLEVAGTVVQAAGRWREGDEVCALVSGGGYAEFCAAPAVQCLPVPEGFTMVDAAAVPEGFFTVWANVFRRGRLQAGETILIHGGSSGIGTTAIQLARTFGARVIVTAGSDAKCEACRRLGAEIAINYKIADFAELRGVNLVLDMVGGTYFAKNMQVLAQDGRIVQIATLQGREVQLDLLAMMHLGATITGSTLRPRSPEYKGAIARELEEKVWPLLARGVVKPVIDRVYPLAEAAKAHARMEEGDHIGKIVLEVSVSDSDAGRPPDNISFR